MDDPPTMIVREVAGYLDVDEKSVYRLVSRGEVPGFKVAGTWRSKHDIDRWIEERKVASRDEEAERRRR